MILFLLLLSFFTQPVFATDTLDQYNDTSNGVNGGSSSIVGFAVPFTPTASGNINKASFKLEVYSGSLSGTVTASLYSSDNSSIDSKICDIGTYPASSISSLDWVEFTNTNTDCPVEASTLYFLSSVLTGNSSGGGIHWSMYANDGSGLYTSDGTSFSSNSFVNFRQYYTEAEPEPTSTPTPTNTPTPTPTPVGHIIVDNLTPPPTFPTPITVPDYINSESSSIFNFIGSSSTTLQTLYPWFVGKSCATCNVDATGLILGANNYSWTVDNIPSDGYAYFGATLDLATVNNLNFSVDLQSMNGFILYDDEICTWSGDTSTHGKCFGGGTYGDFAFMFSGSVLSWLVNGQVVDFADLDIPDYSDFTFGISASSFTGSLVDRMWFGVPPDEVNLWANPTTSTTISKLACNGGNVLENVVCDVKNWFVKAIFALFVPDFSSKALLGSQVTQIKTLLSTRAPLSYLFFPIEYDWDSVFEAVPDSSDTEFTYNLPNVGNMSSPYPITFNLAPEGTATVNFLIWAKDLIGMFLVIPFGFAIFSLVKRSFNITKDL